MGEYGPRHALRTVELSYHDGMTAPVPREERSEEYGRRLGGPLDLQRTWRMMAGGAEGIAHALMSIAEDPDCPPAARVQAGSTVLKMVGFGDHDQVTVRHIPAEFDQAAGLDAGTRTSRSIIDQRMADLRAASLPPAEPEDSEIIEAELVDPG